MEGQLKQSLQVLATALDNAAKAGVFGLQDSTLVSQALQTVAQALFPQDSVSPKGDTVKKAKK